MTRAVPGQEGCHHVNEQPASYGINWLAANSFDFLEEASRQLWAVVPQDRVRHVRKRLLCFSNQRTNDA